MTLLFQKNKYIVIGIIALICLLGLAYVLLVYFPAGEEHRLIQQAANGNMNAARQLIDKIPTLGDSQAQEAAVAVIISDSDISKCKVADGVIVDGLDYGVVCRNNIAYTNALTKLDISWCSQLDGQLISRADCAEQVLAKKLNTGADISVCSTANNATVETNCKTLYWTQTAKKNQNPSLCENITNAANKGACRDGVLAVNTLTKPNTALCNGFYSTVAKNDCLIAKQTTLQKRTNLPVPCSSFLSQAFLTACAEKKNSATP